jgi:hypothetical protein
MLDSLNDFLSALTCALNIHADVVKRDPAALARTLWRAERAVFHCAFSQVRGPKAAARFADAVERLRQSGLLEKDAGPGPQVLILEDGFLGFAKQMWPTDKDLFADYDEKVQNTELDNN